MLKYFSIFAVLFALGSNVAKAQQQEAVLHRVEVPGAGFDFVVATPKARGVIDDLGDTPDALLVRLDGGLAVAFESAELMMQTLDLLKQPVCTSHATSRDGKSRMPVAVYLVPRAD